MYTRGQSKFKTLRLTGREKPRTAPLARLCDLRGCNTYINAGEEMIRWGTYDLHVDCAVTWCKGHGIEWADGS